MARLIDSSSGAMSAYIPASHPGALLRNRSSRLQQASFCPAPRRFFRGCSPCPSDPGTRFLAGSRPGWFFDGPCPRFLIVSGGPGSRLCGTPGLISPELSCVAGYRGRRPPCASYGCGSARRGMETFPYFRFGWSRRPDMVIFPCWGIFPCWWCSSGLAVPFALRVPSFATRGPSGFSLFPG